MKGRSIFQSNLTQCIITRVSSLSSASLPSASLSRASCKSTECYHSLVRHGRPRHKTWCPPSLLLRILTPSCRTRQGLHFGDDRINRLQLRMEGLIHPTDLDQVLSLPTLQNMCEVGHPWYFIDALVLLFFLFWCTLSNALYLHNFQHWLSIDRRFCQGGCLWCETAGQLAGKWHELRRAYAWQQVCLDLYLFSLFVEILVMFLYAAQSSVYSQSSAYSHPK